MDIPYPTLDTTGLYGSRGVEGQMSEHKREKAGQTYLCLVATSGALVDAGFPIHSSRA